MKVRDLKVGDEVISRSDLEHGSVGTVTRIEDRFGGHDAVYDVYFDGARSPHRIHKTVDVEIKGESTVGKGFAK